MRLQRLFGCCTHSIVILDEPECTLPGGCSDLGRASPKVEGAIQISILIFPYTVVHCRKSEVLQYTMF